MATRTDLRPIVKLRSTAGTGFTDVTRKNRRNDPDRVVLRFLRVTYVKPVPAVERSLMIGRRSVRVAIRPSLLVPGSWRPRRRCRRGRWS